MAPFKDDDLRGPTGFDLQTASTLYWKAIPVLLKQHDREDQVEQLTFRILSGVTRQNHNLRVRSRWGRARATAGAAAGSAQHRSNAALPLPRRERAPSRQVLRIHASSEDDPFFLHTLEVSEEDFQGLKADQGILVDFGSFPGKIISLLERCLASQTADMPRFQASSCARAQLQPRGAALHAARPGGVARRGRNHAGRSRGGLCEPSAPPLPPRAGRADHQGRRQRAQGGGDQRLQAAAPHHADLPAGQRRGGQAGEPAGTAVSRGPGGGNASR
jgi:hypothetical protein